MKWKSAESSIGKRGELYQVVRDADTDEVIVGVDGDHPYYVELAVSRITGEPPAWPSLEAFNAGAPPLVGKPHDHVWVWSDPVVIKTYPSPGYRECHQSAWGFPRRCECGVAEVVAARTVPDPVEQARLDAIEAQQEEERQKRREYARQRKEKKAKQEATDEQEG